MHVIQECDGMAVHRIFKNEESKESQTEFSPYKLLLGKIVPFYKT